MRIATSNSSNIAADAVLATPGRRGVVVDRGHVEADPDLAIYLMRFEGAGANLAELRPPVGCLPEELTQDADRARVRRPAMTLAGIFSFSRQNGRLEWVE